MEGRTTAKAIAEGLNLRGLRTPRGEDWSSDNVRRALRNVDELDRAQQHVQDLQNPD